MSEDRFRALAENATVAIFVIDQESTILFANPTAGRIFGYDPAALVGQSLEILMPQEQRQLHHTGIRRYLATGARNVAWEGVELPGLTKDGRVIPLEISFGEFVRKGRRYFTGIVRDISERKQAEEELERLTEGRAELMRGFAHDVKNPLSAAVGLLHILEEGMVDELSATQKEHVSRIRQSIGTALDLIDDLLELARTEAAALQVEHSATRVSDIVQEVTEEQRAQADEKGIALTVDVADALPAIDSDPSRVRQILGNLVSNAVKYTEQGNIDVRVELRDGGQAPGPGPWIVVAVTDTGPGIAEKQQRHLFQEFRRLQNAGGKRGAGIGLAISRTIARALGGDLTVESTVGRGSTFALWLPLRAAPAQPDTRSPE